MTADHQPRGLRIAYPFPGLQIGGAELRALSLVERLPSDRFSVDFLSFGGPGPLDHRARAAGARVCHLGSEPLHGASMPVRAARRSGKLMRYAAAARHSHYDIVDAWLYPMDIFAALGRHVTRTPVIVAGRPALLPRNAFGPLSASLDVIANRFVDAIVANSDAVATAHRGRRGVDPEKLHVIRNGVEIPEPIPAAQRQRLRSEFGADGDSILIGVVGMLRPEKRHALLVEAFAEVAKTRPRVSLAVVGEGPMRTHIERMIDELGVASLVRMPGAVVDIRPTFDAFDIVALSSPSEGMPNALLQGAAAGKPIVTTAAGGAVEVVVDGVTGIVVPIEDRDRLAAALGRLADDAELRHRFGRAGQEHVASAFGMERFVSEWSQLYERLALSKGLLAD